MKNLINRIIEKGKNYEEKSCSEFMEEYNEQSEQEEQEEKDTDDDEDQK